MSAGAFRIERWSSDLAPRWETFVPGIADADTGRRELARVAANERGVTKLMQRSLRLVDADDQVIDEWYPVAPEATPAGKATKHPDSKRTPKARREGRARKRGTA